MKLFIGIANAVLVGVGSAVGSAATHPSGASVSGLFEDGAGNPTDDASPVVTGSHVFQGEVSPFYVDPGSTVTCDLESTVAMTKSSWVCDLFGSKSTTTDDKANLLTWTRVCLDKGDPFLQCKPLPFPFKSTFLPAIPPMLTLFITTLIRMALI